MDDERIVTIVLAGGRGSRMGDTKLHKVLHEVGGVPFILRALQAYEAHGIENVVLVIGEQGEQVVPVVGASFPGVVFAYQPVPRGTGDAARRGVRLLRDAGYSGTIMIAMGDRLLTARALQRLTQTFRESKSDITMLVGSRVDNPSSGRVLHNADGGVVAIVETSDIALSQMVRELRKILETAGSQPDRLELLSVVKRHFPVERKAMAACGALLELLKGDAPLHNGTLRELLDAYECRTTYDLRGDAGPFRVVAADAESMTAYANLATYIFRAPVLYEGLETLDRENAQGEEYLTDAIQNLAALRDDGGAPKYRITSVALEEPEDALTFNTPQQLARLERLMRARQEDDSQLVERPKLLNSLSLRTIAEWHMLFATNAPSVRSFMTHTYGDDPELHARKRASFLRALEYAAERCGMSAQVFIVRSPGRLNLMGRHIDHRGGRTNVVAISDEIIFVGLPREDDTFQLWNTADDQFSSASFSLSELIQELEWSDWLSCVNSPRTLAMVSNGRWENYVKAAALKLQDRFRDIPLKGVTLIAHGTIPIGAGLSSSSAVVVGAAEATVAVNSLSVHANLMVDICGEGEWFVGTRGGANDHAAIAFGRKHQVAHLSFSPFERLGFYPFLPDHSVVVCNSGLQAKKSEGARGTFNKKILGYVVGEILFKRQHPELAGAIAHLRDINPEQLGIPLEELYEALKGIPMRLTRREFEERYGPLEEPNYAREDLQKLANVFATLPELDEPFDVRGVMLFGLAEQDRSKRCVEFLKAGRADEFGQLWYLSHDGDRVVSHDDQMNQVPWEYEVSNDYLTGLARDLRSGDPERVARAQLYMQPGKYACSTPEIDAIVDFARRIPGVKGAQMAGAGLGGCVMILCEDASCDTVVKRMQERGFEAYRYSLVEGAGLVVL